MIIYVWTVRKAAVLTYLNVVVSVVMKVKNSVEFTVDGHADVLGILDSLTKSLSCVLFHLDVVKLPEKLT